MGKVGFANGLHDRFAVGVAASCSVIAKESEDFCQVMIEISIHLLPGMIRCEISVSRQNSSDLAQGSFIFEELNFCRS